MSLTEVLRRINRRFFPSIEAECFPEDAWTDPAYSAWFRQNRATPEELEAQRADTECENVSFSIIVPLYRTPISYLSTLVESVLFQTHDNFELVLVNGSTDDELLSRELRVYEEADSRVRVISLEQNLGIAGNTAAGCEVASGDYVMLLDHDDMIEPNALFEYANAIKRHPDAAFYYCDEDLFESVEHRSGSKRFDAVYEREFVYKNPLFKPDFSRPLLSCKNYILHMLCFKRSKLKKIGIPNTSYDGAQDFKMIIDALKDGSIPCHIPKVLYHWRISAISTATNSNAKPYGRIAYQKCLGEILQENRFPPHTVGTGIDNLFNPWWPHADQSIQVSIIVDVANNEEAAGFLQWFSLDNSYSNVELIFVGIDSIEMTDFNARVAYVKSSYASGLYSRLNEGAKVAQGECLIFLDGGCRFITPEAIEQLSRAIDCAWIGVAAPKTLYADCSIKGYGIAITPDRIMPLYRGFPREWTGYECNLRAFQENSACGWQGLAVRRELFQAIGGFDESYVAEIGTADLCHRVRLEGKSIMEMCTVELMTSEECPHARYDNATNAPDFSRNDLDLFDSKWPGVRSAGDPFFNCNLDQSSGYFQIARNSKER